MNSDKSECVPNTFLSEWDSIKWDFIQKKVKRLQMRIAKAIREGRHGKAKAIQWLLTHSLCAKLLAVKRVLSNKGNKTPGVDKNIWRTSSQKIKAAVSLNKKGYKSLPLLRTYISPRKTVRKDHWAFRQ
jgi:RNA-directed DNA polymerase